MYSFNYTDALCKKTDNACLNPWLQIVLFIAFFNAFPALNAQVLPSGVHQINVEKGLSNGINAFVHRDAYGFVWISSIDGLNRYNGSSVKIFRPTSQPRALYGANIQSPFFEKNNGDIWFTTESAINCYDRKTGFFQHFYVKKGDEWLVNKLYYAFHLSQNRFLWIIVENMLFQFDTETGKSIYLNDFYAPRAILMEYEDARFKNIVGLFWNIADGLEIVHRDTSGNIERDTFFSQYPGFRCSQGIIENNKFFWIANSKGLLHLDPDEPYKKALFPFDGNTQKGTVTAVSQTRQNSSLYVSNPSQIALFDKINRKYQQVLLPDELAKKHQKEGVITALNLDTKDILWYSLEPKGVNFLNTRTTGFKQVLFANKIENNSIRNIIEGRDNQIVCISNEQIITFDSNGNILNFKPNFLPRYSKYCFDQKHNQYWSVSDRQISKIFDDFKGISAVIPFKNRPLDLQLIKNNLYISTINGLFSFDLHRKKSIPVPRLTSFINTSKVINKTLWIGSDVDITAYHFDTLVHLRPHFSLINTATVYDIIEDSTRHLIWAATSKGLLKIKNGPIPQRDTLIDEAGGLPNQYLYAIVLDKKGNLWLSSNKGIIQYMPDAPPGKQFKHYTTRSGLSSNEYNPGAALMSSTGEIWFGGTQGVDVFHPDSVRDIGHAPQLAITGLKIHDKDWSSDTVAIEMATRIDLPYNQNTLRIELAAMEYTDPEMNQFKAMLEPIPGAWQRWFVSMGFMKADTAQWTTLGTQNFITYANLSPGTYRFRFTACNSEGIWQETPRELMLYIRPPYWQTWWFIALVMAAVLALVGIGTAGYYRYRLREQQLDAAQRERALEQERYELERKNLESEKELALRRQRDRVSSDMHDELGGGLVSIGAQSKRAQKFQPPPEVQSILARIGDIAYHLNRNMRNLSWATDPEMDNLSSLLSRLRKETRDFMEDHALEGHIDLPTDFEDLRLSGEFRLHLLRATLEALNNVAKHAQATSVSLTATVGTHLRLALQDNGIGFDPETKIGTSKGLRSMTKRMEALNGTITWLHNEAGQGMTVVMEVPLD